MDYQYIPDTYDYNLIAKKYKTREKYVKEQIEYRKKFIKLLHDYINIDEINKCINNSKFKIPILEDRQYNFYHLEKSFNNNYIYLRNNIHIENLTDEEINYLIQGENISKDFFNKTIDRVLFEDGEKMFYGEPMDETLVQSKSLIFEFAYDQKECETIEQLEEIEKVINECFTIIKKEIEAKLNIKTSFLVYNAIPDLFNKNLKTLS